MGGGLQGPRLDGEHLVGKLWGRRGPGHHLTRPSRGSLGRGCFSAVALPPPRHCGFTSVPWICDPGVYRPHHLVSPAGFPAKKLPISLPLAPICPRLTLWLAGLFGGCPACACQQAVMEGACRALHTAPVPCCRRAL